MTRERRGSHGGRGLRVLLVKTGEPLPDGREVRLWRSGLLAQRLAERGHEVTWLTSTFQHGAKRHVEAQDITLRPWPGVVVEALWAPGYVRHRSVRRLLHHWMLAHRVERWLAGATRPDVVIASLPLPELAACAARQAARWRVPMIVDCRDMWPDNLLEGRRGAGLAMWAAGTAWMRRASHLACRAATAVTGHTEAFVDWGVAQAGRMRSEADRCFPLAYPGSPPPEASLRQAGAQLDRLGIRPEDHVLRVAFVGTLSGHFDLRPMLECARDAAARRHPLEFVVCGDGDRAAAWRHEADGLVSVKWLGWQDAPVIWTLLRRSHLGLAPYNASTIFGRSLPNKVIEYLSAGLPVLSSLRGETEALLQANGVGWTYAGTGARSLAALLEEIRQRPEARAEAAERAHALFEERFDAGRVYDAFASHVAEVARGPDTAGIAAAVTVSGGLQVPPDVPTV
ncbi:MAG: glycosyltransferase family 4 protein [Gemmatimonadales bacterium]